MIPAIYAEFRKLLSIRSTYAITIIAFLIIGIFAFYGAGYQGGPRFSPDALYSAASNAASLLGVFTGIMGILLITGEYRHNTIVYTLTATNNRLKVLGAKTIVLAVYAAIAAIAVVFFAVILMSLGAKMAGTPVAGQQFDTLSLLWKALVHVVTSAWLGLVLGFLFRSQVLAIVSFFVLPNIESLIHTMFKVSGNYLPFTAHNQILMPAPTEGVFSALASAVVLLVYLAIAWVVAAALFLKRDGS